MENRSEITLRSRLLSLVGGTLYLAIVTRLYQMLTNLSLPIAALLVLCAAAAITSVIAIFCTKWVSQQGAMRQMSLSTLFLPFIPISIYLALYSQILNIIRGLEFRNAPFAWLLHIYYLAFVALSTIVLLWLGEAVVWMAMVIHRNFSIARIARGRRNKSSKVDLVRGR
jgi:hypothetical protein